MLLLTAWEPPPCLVSPRPRPTPVVCAGLVVADHLCPPLDHLPRAGELIAVDELVLNIGGGAANTAVDLARLGVTATICARVGDDIFGRFATETLRAHKVDTSALKIDPRLATSQTLIVNVRGQDRRFIHSVGANTGFVAADLDAVLEQPPRVLHIGYFLILPNLDAAELAERFARGPASRHGDRARRGHARAGRLSRAAQGRPSPYRRLRAQHRRSRADPGRDRPGSPGPGISRPGRAPGGRSRAASWGSSRSPTACASSSAPIPISFVDGSGGGDAFNAGYIVGLLEGRSELDCLKLASAVGASCVRSVGTTAGVFTRAEAEEFVGSTSCGRTLE